MSSKESKPATPFTGAQFDRAYRSPFIHWIWSDLRIPAELKELVAARRPQTALELGCGLGRFSAYLAEQGIHATGVDFSQVAIAKAGRRLADKEPGPVVLVGDVTDLVMLHEPFDLAFDIGCFHCLRKSEHPKYAAEAYRLLKPGSTLLIWAMDSAPSDLTLGPQDIANAFSPGFQLADAKFSRRRIVASHWYWLVRNAGAA